MINQLARSIEMVLLKQLKLITGSPPKSSGLHLEGSKLEMWVGTKDAEHQERQFKITIEEII
jgi:hypothetical protein